MGIVAVEDVGPSGSSLDVDELPGGSIQWAAETPVFEWKSDYQFTMVGTAKKPVSDD